MACKGCRVNPVRLVLLAVTVYLVTSLLCLGLLALWVHRALRAAPAWTASRSWDPPVLPPQVLPGHLGNGDAPGPAGPAGLTCPPGFVAAELEVTARGGKARVWTCVG